MVWAFLLYLIFGGGSHPAMLGEFTSRYLKPQVKAVVTDPPRREAALAALKVLQGHLDALNDHHAADMKQYEALVQDYRSKPEDFDRLFAAGTTTRLQGIDQVWADRAELLKHLRPGEWEAIIAGAKAEAAKAAR